MAIHRIHCVSGSPDPVSMTKVNDVVAPSLSSYEDHVYSKNVFLKDKKKRVIDIILSSLFRTSQQYEIYTNVKKKYS